MATVVVGASRPPLPGPAIAREACGWSEARVGRRRAKRRGCLQPPERDRPSLRPAAVTRPPARMRRPQPRPPRLLPSLIRVLGERAPCACPAVELLIKLHWGEAQRRRRESAPRPPGSECGARGRAGERAGLGEAGSAGTRLPLWPQRPDSGGGGGVRPRAERKPPGPAGREVGRIWACGVRAAGTVRPVRLRRPRRRPGASWGGAATGSRPSAAVAARTAEGGVRDAPEGSSAPLLSRGAGGSALSKPHPQYTPPVGLPCSAEQPGLLRCKAVQWLDESVPPSLCVSKIRIRAYRWELRSGQLWPAAARSRSFDLVSAPCRASVHHCRDFFHFV